MVLRTLRTLRKEIMIVCEVESVDALSCDECCKKGGFVAGERCRYQPVDVAGDGEIRTTCCWVTFVVLMSLEPRPLLGSAIICAVHCKNPERGCKIRNLSDSTEPLDVFVRRTSDHFAVEAVQSEGSADRLFDIPAGEAEVSQVSSVLPRSDSLVNVVDLLQELGREIL
jgi:hypothetical protein